MLAFSMIGTAGAFAYYYKDNENFAEAQSLPKRDVSVL
jgi:hypothetical protein